MFIEWNVRVGILEVQAGWNLLVFQHQQRLAHRCNAGRGFQVTQVGLARTDDQILIASRPKHAPQRLRFRRIANCGARAVSFDILHLRRIDARIRIHIAQQVFLRFRVRHGNTAGAPVLIRAAANDYAVNLIAISNSIVQPLQHKRPASFGSNETVCGCVERLAASIRRKHRRLRKADKRFRVDDDVHTANDRQFRFTVRQTLRRAVECNQR